MIGFVIATNIVAHFQIPELALPNFEGDEKLVVAPNPSSVAQSFIRCS